MYEEQSTYGKSSVIYDQDGILITARTKTDENETVIEVISPQLRPMLKQRGSFDNPAIIISITSNNSRPFHTHCVWSTIDTNYETAEEAIKSAASHIKDAIKEYEAELNPQDSEQLVQQMERDLAKLDIRHQQPK